MKKMLAAVFMVGVLCLGEALSAYANTGFDESVLNRAEDIYYKDGEGIGIYGIDSIYNSSATWRTIEGMPGGVKVGIAVEPVIGLNRIKEFEKFIINVKIDSLSGEEIAVDGVRFRIGNTNNGDSRDYTDHSFSVDLAGSTSYEHKNGSQRIQGNYFIGLNQNSFYLLDDLTAHRNEQMTLFVKPTGVNSDWISCYSFTQNEIDSFIHLYNLYKEAGGTREENLQAIKDKASTYWYNDYVNGTFQLY